MANEKKSDKKAFGETPPPPPTPPTETPSVAQEVLPTALVTLPKAALTTVKVPTVEELEALAAEATYKFEALSKFLSDTGISDVAKAKVEALIAQANPIKPGMEEISLNWSVTRIVLTQPTTNDPKKPESARPGDLFTTLGQLLERPFKFIPLYFNEENIMFKQGEKAPECAAPDAKLGHAYGECAKCPHLPFGKQNGGRGKQNKTNCQNQIVVALLAEDLSNVYVIQFGKTSRGAGSALIALAKGQPFPWKQSYQLTTQKEVGDLGTYYIYKIEPTGKDNSLETQQIAKALSELYQANRKKLLGEYYYRAQHSEGTAAAAEASFVDDDKLEKGLEPDLSGAAAAPGPSVRGSAKPM